MSRLKVTTGIYGGRLIETIESNTTRPTSTRAKEALFSALTSYLSYAHGLSNKRVLDLFSGSGALGIEALSRGALFAFFCEIDPRAFRMIDKNLRDLNVDQQKYKILKSNSFSTSTLKQIRIEDPFDIVFLDPPYSENINKIQKLIRNLFEFGIIDKQTIVYLERNSKEQQIIEKSDIKVIYQKSFGEVACNLFCLKE